MIQDIIDGIVAALLEAFPDVPRVYTEQVKQGLKEPCFILRLLNPTNEQFLGNRYFRTHLFSVQYIPENTTDAEAECYAVTDSLFRALEYITVGGDLQRGTAMNAEYFGSVATFFVNYDMFVDVVHEPESMETLELENLAK